MAMKEAFWGAGIFAAAGAIFLGFVLIAANWQHPVPRQIEITVHIDQPLVVKMQ